MSVDGDGVDDNCISSIVYRELYRHFIIVANPSQIHHQSLRGIPFI